MPLRLPALVLFRLLPAVLLLAPALPAPAQILSPDPPLLVLRAADYEAGTFVPPPVVAGKRGAAPAAEIEVTYVGFPEEVREAFAYAVGIWETLVKSPVTIRVRAVWEPLERGVLGSAGPQLVANFPGVPVRDTWYPSALAEALAGNDFTEGEPDVFASFNSDLGLWYFGLDGRTPAGAYDFATVVLHELGHGLGFVGSFGVDDGETGDGDVCPGAPAGYGCWGIGQRGFPVIFDRFTEDVREVKLLDTSAYPNPSPALGSVLQSDAVFFEGTATRAANQDVPVNLYAPENFDLGSSYSHLDERIFPAGDLNSLMTPQLARSEAIHSPGPIACGIFEDIGWPLAEGCLALLDLGLVSFDVEAEADDVVVEWLAFNAPSTLRFEVQRSFFDDPFETVAVIPGTAVEPTDLFTYTASSLEPGQYTFRLRQVMDDGSVFISPEVTVFVELPGELFVSPPYPNPFSAETHVYLLAEETREVAVEVYDVRGVRVERLFEGTLPAETRLALTFEAAGLSSGVYFILVRSGAAEESHSVVYVR